MFTFGINVGSVDELFDSGNVAVATRFKQFAPGVKSREGSGRRTKRTLTIATERRGRKCVRRKDGQIGERKNEVNKPSLHGLAMPISMRDVTKHVTKQTFVLEHQAPSSSWPIPCRFLRRHPRHRRYQRSKDPPVNSHSPTPSRGTFQERSKFTL